MKRKVLCVFSLILILLTFCTLFSPKAETEMQTYVEVKKLHGTGKAARNLSISKAALTWPDSQGVLYNIVEGTGWESGSRVASIPAITYDDYEEYVKLGPGTDYLCIYSASRTPQLGSGVAPLEKTWKGDDIYLLVMTQEVEDLSVLHTYGMTERQRSEKAALMDVRRAVYPFFEHRTWYALKDELGEDLRIYSLYDIVQFLDAVPWIAGTAMVLLCSLLLWGASWVGKAERRKGILILNILLIAGLMAALPWMLNQFDLPASLMPKECILDIPHYLDNFRIIFSSLESMGSRILADATAQAASRSAIIVGGSLLAVICVIILEIYLLKRKKE